MPAACDIGGSHHFKEGFRFRAILTFAQVAIQVHANHCAAVNRTCLPGRHCASQERSAGSTIPNFAYPPTVGPSRIVMIGNPFGGTCTVPTRFGSLSDSAGPTSRRRPASL